MFLLKVTSGDLYIFFLSRDIRNTFLAFTSIHRSDVSLLLQVLCSRFASPHVNVRLDSRPVSSSVALPDADHSGGALLVATGNKVGNGPKEAHKYTLGSLKSCRLPCVHHQNRNMCDANDFD